MVRLGSRVRDLITGLTGIAIARTEWLYGCARVVVEPTELRDGKPMDAVWFDEQRVEEIEPNVMPVVEPGPVDIALGNKVKDKITGFQGVAVAKTIWSSGSVTLSIEPTELHDRKPIEAQAFDSHRVQLLEETSPPVSKSHSAVSGGPQNDPKHAR